MRLALPFAERRGDEPVAATASRLGRPVGHLVREAVAYYLAAAAAYGAAQAAGGAAPPQQEAGGIEVPVDDGADAVKKAR